MTKQEMLARTEEALEAQFDRLTSRVNALVEEAWEESRKGVYTEKAEEFAKEIVELTKQKYRATWALPESELPIRYSDDFEEYYGPEARCPECDARWIMNERERMHFCPGCGRPVQWTKGRTEEKT